MKTQTLTERADIVEEELKKKLGEENFRALMSFAFEYACREHQYLGMEKDDLLMVAKSRRSSTIIEMYKFLDTHSFPEGQKLQIKYGMIYPMLRKQHDEGKEISLKISDNLLGYTASLRR